MTYFYSFHVVNTLTGSLMGRGSGLMKLVGLPDLEAVNAKIKDAWDSEQGADDAPPHYIHLLSFAPLGDDLRPHGT